MPNFKANKKAKKIRWLDLKNEKVDSDVEIHTYSPCSACG